MKSHVELIKMFELLCIFTSGGIVLWHQGTTWAPLNMLVSQILIQEKTHYTQFKHESYIVKWLVVPSLEIVLSAVYLENLPLLLVDELLETMRWKWLKLVETPLEIPVHIEFEKEFSEIYQTWMNSCKETKRPENTENFNLFLPNSQSNSASSPKKKNSAKPKKVSQKARRTWGYTEKITKRKIERLNMSKESENYEARPAFLEEVSSDSEEEEEKQPTGLLARLGNKLRSYAGNKQLTNADVFPVIEYFKDQLIQKNVAEEIAVEVCQSVAQNLVTTTTQSFTSVNETVRLAVQESIERLLSRGESIDPLRQALAAKVKQKPYVVVFCGVNGVGKSTSLAKVGYFLKTKGDLSLMIAACDTFRSGAVEQLRIHANTLEVPLFEEGYGKEPANVAKEAIRSASEKGIDVVLVDTAGRMQHNEELMSKLANLVNINEPDLVLFVGEALVGNDGVDELVTFNRILTDRTHDGRGVDGVLLTKFDTVDDKVGATLSMVYSTDKPIVFVGVGERYGHLKRLNTKMVVSSLLSEEFRVSLIDCNMSGGSQFSFVFVIWEFVSQKMKLVLSCAKEFERSAQGLFEYYDNQLAYLKEEVKSMLEKNEYLEVKINESIATSFSETHQNALAELLKEIEFYKESYEKSEFQLNEEEKRCKKLNEKKEELQIEFETLYFLFRQKEKDTIMKELEDSKSLVSNLKSNNEELNSRVDFYISDIKVINEDRENSLIKIKKLEDENRELISLSQDNLEESNRLKEKILELHSENEILLETNEELRQSNRKLFKQLSDEPPLKKATTNFCVVCGGPKFGRMKVCKCGAAVHGSCSESVTFTCKNCLNETKNYKENS